MVTGLWGPASFNQLQTFLAQLITSLTLATVQNFMPTDRRISALRATCRFSAIIATVSTVHTFGPRCRSVKESGLRAQQLRSSLAISLLKTGVNRRVHLRGSRPRDVAVYMYCCTDVDNRAAVRTRRCKTAVVVESPTGSDRLRQQFFDCRGLGTNRHPYLISGTGLCCGRFQHAP